MQDHFNPFTKLVSVCLLTLLFTACSGGGDSESPKVNTSGTISYTDLPISQRYDENTPVELSLQVENPDNLALIFEWKVTHRGENHPFSGQGTDSISFTTPEVDQTSTMNVSVNWKLRGDARLFGPDSASTSITVVETDPDTNIDLARLLTGNAINHHLNEVDAIDLEILDLEGVWKQAQFVSANGLSVGTFSLSQIKKNDLAKWEVENCQVSDNQSLLYFIGEATYLQEPCDTASTTQYFQEANEFQVLHYCDDTLINAVNFKKASSNDLSQLSSFELSIDNNETTITDDLCFNIGKSHYTIDDTSATATGVVIKAPYEDDAISITLLMDKATNGISFGRFGSNSPLNLNKLTINAPALQLSNVDANDGDYTSYQMTEEEIELSFEGSFQTSGDEQVEIEGKLIFKSE